jgi:hypothetical protein
MRENCPGGTIKVVAVFEATSKPESQYVRDERCTKSRVEYPYSRLRIIYLGISTGSNVNEIQIPGSDGPLIDSACTRSLACMLQGPSSASSSPAFPVGVDARGGGGGVAADRLYLRVTMSPATSGSGSMGR